MNVVETRLILQLADECEKQLKDVVLPPEAFSKALRSLCRLAGKEVEEMVNIADMGAKDHAIKTRQSEFLKMFPDAYFCRDVINILPCSIEKEMCKCCGDRECEECRKDYWLTEVTDND